MVILVNKAYLIGMRKGEELKAPRHASAAATRDGNLPSRDGSLPYVTATCLIPDNNYKIAKLPLGPLVRIPISILILNYILPRRLRLEA
jgi:hypothetical protein